MFYVKHFRRIPDTPLKSSLTCFVSVQAHCVEQCAFFCPEVERTCFCTVIKLMTVAEHTLFFTFQTIEVFTFGVALSVTVEII